MLSYCSSRLAGLSIDPVPAFSVKCAFLPQLVRLEIQYKRETITLFLSFLRKNYSTDVLQQNFHTLSRLFYDIWLSHFIFPVLKENLRKQKVPVYNLSSYFLHLFFFLQTDKTFFDKKKKKSESVQCIQLKITAHHKLEMPQKQQQAPRRTNIAAGIDHANDSIQCKRSLKTNPKSDIPPAFIFSLQAGKEIIYYLKI